jgi:hypothetical protein
MSERGLSEEELQEIERRVDDEYPYGGLSDALVDLRALIAEVRRLRGRATIRGSDERGEYIEWREENGMRSRFYAARGLTITE